MSSRKADPDVEGDEDGSVADRVGRARGLVATGQVSRAEPETSIAKGQL